jgi:hypothetical protein
MVFNMTSWRDLLPDSFLNEAKTDDAATDTSAVTDSSGNKDLESDTKDATSDSTDLDADTADATSDSSDGDSDTTDDAQPSSDDTSDDSSTASAPDIPPNNKEKKLYLYESLREIKSDFEKVLDLLEVLITSDLPDANLDTLKSLRTKVITNIDLLKDLLSNTNIAKSKSYEDLQLIHNIYVADLKAVEANLNTFSRLLKSKK